MNIYKYSVVNFEVKQIVINYYNKVYDKILNRINEIAKSYVVYFCQQAINHRRELNIN